MKWQHCQESALDYHKEWVGIHVLLKPSLGSGLGVMTCPLLRLQVVRYKHADKDGITSLVLGCGSKKEKQLHPSAVGEFRR